MGKYFSAALCSLSLLFSETALSSDTQLPPDSGFTLEQEKELARFRDLSQQLDEELGQKAVLADTLANLEQQVAGLVTANLQLSQRQATLLDAQAKTEATKAPARVIVNDKAPTDARTSYAVGAWYAENAPQEAQRLASIGKTLDLPAFAQGFNDKLNDHMQLPQDTLTTELATIDQQLEDATRLKNQQQSQALLAAAAKEKGAVTLPGGAVYRILDKGKATTVTQHSDILFEFDEQLGTGEVLAQRETRNSAIKRLPPPFQAIFKQLGLGGSAKIHIPMTQADGRPNTSRDLPPGTISIVTVKVIGIR